MALVDELIKDGWLKTPEIIDAFRKIKRADFMPEGMKHMAEINEALPIGSGQTISQPLTVAFMLEELKPKVGDKILDVGSGSGWTTALLSQIVSAGKTQKGKVIAIELLPELKEFGEKNASKYNFVKQGIAEFICVDGSKGYPNIATRPELAEGFDKILCSAAVQQDEVPPAWKKQLKIKGRIVAPIRSSIWTLVKKSEKDFEETEHSGFGFVPLVQK